MASPLVRNPAERAKVHATQTAIGRAVAQDNQLLVAELMRELARLTGQPCPRAYLLSTHDTSTSPHPARR